MRRRGLIPVLLVVCAAAAPAVASGQSAPDAGKAFDPHPISKPVYGILGPLDDGARPEQEYMLRGAGDVEILLETWLPKSQGERTPPSRLPVVTHMTPYEQRGHVYPQFMEQRWLQALVPRGFAYTRVHLRGSGQSGGCMDHLSDDTVEDLTRALEWMAGKAPWAGGRVGSIGLSHHGGSQIALAGRGDPDRVRPLKAMVVGSPYSSAYSARQWEGVPFYLHEALTHVGHSSYGFSPGYDPTNIQDEQTLAEYAEGRLQPGGTPEPRHLPERVPCRVDAAPEAIASSGDFTPYFAERESRRGAPNIRAATLMVHGLHDLNVHPHNQIGLFDRIPRRTPRAGIFGWFDHSWPDKPGFRPEWRRANFMDDIVAAWFDHWLKRKGTGADRWPVAQVQDSTGQWRAEPNWPFIRGRAGQLALSGGSALGAVSPVGSSTYTEGLYESSQLGVPPGAAATWQTGPLPGPLHLAGPVVLDAHVVLDNPDAHLAARLEAVDAQGEPIPTGAGARRYPDGGWLMAFRSMRHLDPMPRGYFEQAEGKPAPTGRPTRVTLRFDPTDLVIPKGGRLKLTLAGTLTYGPGAGEGAIGQPSEPSYARTRVTVLHDCEHPSLLRFLMPRKRPRHLNVREHDEPASEPLPSNPSPSASRKDGGGAATSPVCGRPPRRTEGLRSTSGR